MVGVKRREFEGIRHGLARSMQLIEEIEFREGVARGREQFQAGRSISLDDYKKKHQTSNSR